MKIGPKFKIARRLGAPIFEKTQTQKYQVSLSRKEAAGKMPRQSRSEYGRQHTEKQKVRYTYGVSEKQFSNYVKKALAAGSADQIGQLYRLLESRLDNAIYRVGLAKTRRAARQFVSHGHLLVNGRKVTIPSYTLSEGDAIAIRPGSAGAGMFAGLSERLKEWSAPKWLTFDPERREGKVLALPSTENAQDLDLRSVFEFYSR